MQILEALRHCHELGITHRAIKPENIMYNEDGVVFLADFGLGKDATIHMKAYIDAPYFTAPEVLDGVYTTKWDIWSLGCVLYMLMSGKLPYKGSDTREVI